MMKKFFLLWILFMCLILPGLAECRENEKTPGRGLYVSLIQDPPTLSSRQEITKLVDFAQKARVQDLFIQIYRANQAWFPSKIADSTPYEAALKSVQEDPFAFLIQQAHRAGIRVHAWLNMLSLSVNEEAPILKKYGPEILTRNLKEKRKLEDYKIDSQYFLEPGDLRVRKDLANMVEEILHAYPGLDGIQFDYIRYPDTEPAYGFTDMNVRRFTKATGVQQIDENSLDWKNWKRKQVTEFLELLVKRTHLIRPDIRISATGCMPYARAYHEAFQNWPSWIDRGLVDFVTAMNYSPTPLEFERRNLVAKSKTLDFRKVYLGVGAYKLLNMPGIFEQEFRSCEKMDAGACVIFHYGSLLENPALAKPFLNKALSVFPLQSLPLVTLQSRPTLQKQSSADDMAGNKSVR